MARGAKWPGEKAAEPDEGGPAGPLGPEVAGLARPEGVGLFLSKAELAALPKAGTATPMNGPIGPMEG